MANSSIIQNKLYGTVVVHSSGSNTIVVAGNSTVSTIATGDEVLTGAVIKQIWWGGSSASDNWVIARNSKTVGVYNGTGHVTYSAFGTALNSQQTSNVDLTFTGTSGYIMIEFQKIANNYPSTY